MKRKELFGVILYVAVYMLLAFLYCFSRILAECAFFDPSKLPVDFDFPLEIYSWGLLLICGFYSGIDFGLPTKFKLKTAKQKSAKAVNVLVVAIALTLVLAETVFLNIRFGYDFSVPVGDDIVTLKKVSLPMKEISIALVMTWLFFVTGKEIVNEDAVCEN